MDTDFATDAARLLLRELTRDPAGVADFREAADFGVVLLGVFLGGEGALGRTAAGGVFDFGLAGNSL